MSTIETKSHEEINEKETKAKKGDESSYGDIFPCEAPDVSHIGIFLIEELRALPLIFVPFRQTPDQNLSH